MEGLLPPQVESLEIQLQGCWEAFCGVRGPLRRSPGIPAAGQEPAAANGWCVVAWTSLAWLAVLGVTVAGFLSVLERQDKKLELLLERTAPAALPR
jgi:hypothetical protein